MASASSSCASLRGVLLASLSYSARATGLTVLLACSERTTSIASSMGSSHSSLVPSSMSTASSMASDRGVMGCRLASLSYSTLAIGLKWLLACLSLIHISEPTRPRLI
eukprot:334171-Rhodomonas_salina.1